MPVKIGNGGHGNENYDPETGKYVGTDKGNFSDSDKKILNSMGLDGENFYDSLSEEEKAEVDSWYNNLRPGDKEINSIDDLEEIKDDGTDSRNFLKDQWNRNGFDDTESPKKFDDIYDEFIEEKNRAPKNIDEIYNFIEEKVDNFYKENGGYDESLNEKLPYKIRMKAR